MNLNQDIYAEMLRLSQALEMAVNELRTAGHVYAATENRYRFAKSAAYLASSGTVAERTAHVDKACTAEHLASHEAEAENVACHESVRSIRSQLSALQSIAAASRAELEMNTFHSAHTT